MGARQLKEQTLALRRQQHLQRAGVQSNLRGEKFPLGIVRK